MYDKSDPRAVLSSSASGKPPGGSLSEASYGLFYRDPPGKDDANGKTWYCRGQNFVIAYSDALPGATFDRADQPDEFMAILPDPDTPVIAAAGSQVERSDGYALIIMPPGKSSLTLPKGGRLVRIFSSQAPDIAAKAANAADYASHHSIIPQFEPWPEPPAGFKIRAYSLDVPPLPGRFGRIWRCTTIMVNMPDKSSGPRDRTKVSPHHHDDFEQCSLALEGTWMHHMRWPWSINMDEWHADEHATVESPSVTVIPAQVVHTSTWHSDVNQLVDIFAPPRRDFSMTKDWVLNEDEYPMP